MAKKTSPVNKIIQRGGEKKDSSQQSAFGDQIISRVRELAWAGQHAEAIELVTETLSRSGLQPDIQMELLDLRADSYKAIGKLTLASKYANAMVNLANRERNPVFKAQALNRKAYVQTWTAQEKAALRTAFSAIKTRYSSAAVRANSFLRLSIAQRVAAQYQLAAESARQVIAFFQEVGDIAWTGRASELAFSLYNLGRNDEAHQTGQTTLKLCQSVVRLDQIESHSTIATMAIEVAFHGSDHG